MKRRDFLFLSSLAGLGGAVSANELLDLGTRTVISRYSSDFKELVFNLLKDWCDGMIRTQIINPSDPKTHGLLDCPACEHVHARSIDAVYPFLYMAKASGDKKYLEAGIAAFEWGENVTRVDGAWTNDLDPNSWDGTTVFAAIALAETLHYHGDLLEEERRKRWYARLAKATEFVYNRFDSVGNANINYSATTIYALNLIGRLLDNPMYLNRSKEMAAEIKRYFTKTNSFLFGEIQGDKRRKSPKGLQGIDLGYNTEESLNNLVLYALQENDEELLQLLIKSLNTHLEFIIPDGGLDNGFGNRMYKWSYWGSRTSDGMQPAFAMMANHNPAFGTAVFKNTGLLKQCTHNGLLHGGLHYLSHGIKPCVHHTFAHAKPLAAMLDNWEHLPEINKSIPLPRAAADGVKYYEELDVSLFARGDWRGTISAYDAVYNPRNDCRQATGGALALLYHNRVGLLCTASMAVYKMQEANNQQPAPGEDIALTPRIETYKDNTWYTNLFDLAATYNFSDKDKTIEYTATVQLKNESGEVVEESASDFVINYRCTEEKVEISVSSTQTIKKPTSLVLPIVSPRGETVMKPSDKEISIRKPEGTVKICSNVTLKIKEMAKSRTFNMVPGVEAVPVIAHFGKNDKKVKIAIEVIENN
ncbi:hypothetical protein GCM10028791_38470 [Echinicola sediminis]